MVYYQAIFDYFKKSYMININECLCNILNYISKIFIVTNASYIIFNLFRNFFKNALNKKSFYPGSDGRGSIYSSQTAHELAI